MQDYGFCFVNFELFWYVETFFLFFAPLKWLWKLFVGNKERGRYQRLIAYLYSFRNRKTCELTFSEMYAVLSILHNKVPKLIKSEDF
jgi:hypothetical protein